MSKKVVKKDIPVLVIHHKIYINNSEKQICLILVRSTIKLSKLKTLLVCKISYQPNESWGIRNGDIYYRDCDETKRLDDFNLWHEIISELEYKHQECENEI